MCETSGFPFTAGSCNVEEDSGRIEADFVREECSYRAVSSTLGPHCHVSGLMQWRQRSAVFSLINIGDKWTQCLMRRRELQEHIVLTLKLELKGHL